MEFMTAALLLTWVVLAVLAFGLAGLLRQLRDVQASLRAHADVTGEPTAPAVVWPIQGQGLAIVLVADDTCPICADLIPELPAVAEAAPTDVDVVVVASGSSTKWQDASPDRVRVVTAPDALRGIDPGWRPALLAIDDSGRVLAAEPVGNRGQFRDLVAAFFGAGLEMAERRMK